MEKIISYKNLLKKLPTEVKKIFEIFIKDGDEIRLVGGCVRDLILDKKTDDFDFATKLLPAEVLKILQENNYEAEKSAINFGVLRVKENGLSLDIATLRQDVESDGRYCKAKFVDDYFLDASRRDFTINALYLDYQGLVHDYFSGISDLENKIVKFIGDPKKRIDEDYLRILRFIRFTLRYGSSFDNEGLKASIEKIENLKSLSFNKVENEFLKMLK